MQHLASTLAALLLCANSAFASEAPSAVSPGQIAARPVAGIVSIVIDDIGNRRAESLRAVELPGSVTYAVLPYTAYGSTLARLAHSLGKEVIVHMPMEAVSGRALGRGGLTANLSRQQFEKRALAAITSVPHAQGLSNHMGSRLTAMDRPMQWLMEILLTQDNLMFLDSRTTAATIAQSTAHDFGLRTTFRDVFLDNELSVPAIRARFRELIAKARVQGSAVAIGHPHAQTLQVLAEELPRVFGARAGGATDARSMGMRLVPLSQLISTRSARSFSRHPARPPQSDRRQARRASSSIKVRLRTSSAGSHPDRKLLLTRSTAQRR